MERSSKLIADINWWLVLSRRFWFASEYLEEEGFIFSQRERPSSKRGMDRMVGCSSSKEVWREIIFEMTIITQSI